MNQEIIKLKQEMHKRVEVSNDDYNASERIIKYVKKLNPNDMIESRINIFYDIYIKTLSDD